MDEKTCCFFGHSDAPSNIEPKIKAAIMDLHDNGGVTEFLVGDKGNFDRMVYHALKELSQAIPTLNYKVVLSSLPVMKKDLNTVLPENTVYPEGIEKSPKRFAIDWRNRWMVGESDIVVCYIEHSWGGAAKYVELAAKKEKQVVNLAQN